MTLCRLLVLDFTDDIGDTDAGGEKLYNRGDTWLGREYALGLLDDGYTLEPFYRFDLHGFANWCDDKLRGDRTCT